MTRFYAPQGFQGAQTRKTAAGGMFTLSGEGPFDLADPVDIELASKFFVQTPGNPTPIALSTSALNYKDTILGTLGLLSYWRLNDSGGASAVDQNGAATGTYTNSYALNQTGPLQVGTSTAAALTNTATGDYIDFGDVWDFPNNNPFSIEAWINQTSTDGASRIVVGKRQLVGGSTNGYDTFVNNGRFSLRRRSGGTSEQLQTGVSTISPGVWYHTVSTYDGSNLQVYLNGALAAGPLASSRLLGDNTGPLRVGNTGGDLAASAGTGWQGKVAEVAVYSRALPLSEVQAHYNIGTRGYA